MLLEYPTLPHSRPQPSFVSFSRAAYAIETANKKGRRNIVPRANASAPGLRAWQFGIRDMLDFIGHG
jgi:hypothetical protein